MSAYKTVSVTARGMKKICDHFYYYCRWILIHHLPVELVSVLTFDSMKGKVLFHDISRKRKRARMFYHFVENALEKLAKEEYASFLSLFDSSRITTEDELILALKYLDETCPITKIDDPALKLNHQRINLIAFRDGDGYQMDYDLTTDGEPNDLTLQIEFLKTENGYIVSLDDLHTL